MAMIIGFILILLGLAFGSFINALEYRLETKMSIVGPSICPKCKKPIKWYDLVPVFSWILLRGKCRNCGQKISFQYPLIELITAVSFVGVGISSGLVQKLNSIVIPAKAGISLVSTTPMTISLIASLVLLLLVTAILILVALYDAKTTYVLSTFVYVGIALSLVLIVLNSSFLGEIVSSSCHSWCAARNLLSYSVPYLLSALIPALYFFSLYFFSKGKWMGAGDTEIALLMGLFLGWPRILVAYFFAFIVGSVYGLILIKNKKAGMKSEVPFGPFLVAGTIFGFLFGQQIFSLYVKILLGA